MKHKHTDNGTFLNLAATKYWKQATSNISEKAQIGDGCVIHSHVSIHDEVIIGDGCKIEAGVYIPNGVTIEDFVFIGPHVVFTNDPTLIDGPWTPTPTLVKEKARIGANASIRAGVTIGKEARIGFGRLGSFLFPSPSLQPSLAI